MPMFTDACRARIAGRQGRNHPPGPSRRAPSFPLRGLRCPPRGSARSAAYRIMAFRAFGLVLPGGASMSA